MSCLYNKRTLSNAVTIVDGMALCEACCREHITKVRKLRKELEQKEASSNIPKDYNPFSDKKRGGTIIAPSPSEPEPPTPEPKD